VVTDNVTPAVSSPSQARVQARQVGVVLLRNWRRSRWSRGNGMADRVMMMLDCGTLGVESTALMRAPVVSAAFPKQAGDGLMSREPRPQQH